MPNVQFQEEQSYQRFGAPKPQGGLIGLVMKFGLAKNQKDAQIVLIGVLILVLILTFFMIYRWQSAATANMPPPLPVSIPQ